MRWRPGSRCGRSGWTAFHAFLDERLAAAAAMPSAADLVVEGDAGGAGRDHRGGAASGAAGAVRGRATRSRCWCCTAPGWCGPIGWGARPNSIRAFVEGEGGGPRLKAMMFRAREGALADALLARAEGVPLHLAGHLRAEEWNGSVSPCFVISDARGGVRLG